jgi:chromosome segregation ATPase
MAANVRSQAGADHPSSQQLAEGAQPMSDDIKASNIFKAERELRDFAKTLKSVSAIAEALEEVGGLQKLMAEIQANIEALRVTEEGQRAQTQGLIDENDRLKIKIAEHKQRLSALTGEARTAESLRDEALRITEQARQELAKITAEHASVVVMLKAAVIERDEALKAGAEANVVHQALADRIAKLKAQIAAVGQG